MGIIHIKLHLSTILLTFYSFLQLCIYMKKETKHISLERDVYEQVEKLASDDGRSFSSMASKLIKEALSNRQDDNTDASASDPQHS